MTQIGQMYEEEKIEFANQRVLKEKNRDCQNPITRRRRYSNGYESYGVY